MHAARQQDRRLAVALLAAAVAHTPEAEEVLRGARMRMARKPSAVARELLRNFPKSGGSRRRRRKGGKGKNGNADNGSAKAKGAQGKGSSSKKGGEQNGASGKNGREREKLDAADSAD